MARRALVVLILAVVGSFALRCGSSTKTTTTTTGTVYTLIGDSPACDVLGARFNITELILYFSGLQTGSGLLNATNTLIPIDLAALRDSTTVLNDSTTATGSYDRISLGIDVASMYVYNPSANPPITTLTENLTTPSPLVYDISPALNIPVSGVAVVSLDFDLDQSVLANSQGQPTGLLNPRATATAPPIPTATTINGFGEVDGTFGFVQSVQSVSTLTGGIQYTGGLTVQLLASTVSGSGGASLTAELTPNSVLCGPTTFSNQACCQSGVSASTNPACSIPEVAINSVPTGSYAAVDGFVDSNGEFQTKTVFIGPQEIVADQQVAFIGPVLSINTDTSGNVTGFNMFLRDMQPTVAGVTLDALTTVTLSTGTLYNTVPPPIYTTTSPSTAQGTNFAALPFGPDQITVGQDVVVHGVYTTPSAGTSSGVAQPVSMVANEIDDNLQTHEGNFVSLLAAQPDNLTGAFALQPCAMIDQQNSSALPIYVFTSPQTVFVNAAGLSSLQAQASIMVRGLLFYEPQSVVVNGVTVPAGKTVMLAKQVAVRQ